MYSGSAFAADREPFLNLKKVEIEFNYKFY